MNIPAGWKLEVDCELLFQMGILKLVPTSDVKVSESVKPTPRPPPRPTYITRAAKGWEMRFGAGTALYGRLGKAMKPLVEAHGEDAVMRAWARYLNPTNTPDDTFVSVEAFAQKYAQWARDRAIPVTTAQRVDLNALASELAQGFKEARLGE